MIIQTLITKRSSSPNRREEGELDDRLKNSTPSDALYSNDLRFGLKRFRIAFWISLLTVSIHFLLFLIHGIIHRLWEGEMAGFFVIPAIFIFFLIVGGGGVIWIFGFKILRLISRLIYLIFARKRCKYVAWDSVFCRSLWPLPWAFGIGAVVYITYFVVGWGGSPDDVIVGAIGNLLGAFCYGTLFYNWYNLCRNSAITESEQRRD